MEPALLLLELLKRPVGTLVPLLALLIVQGGVPVEEGATADILAGNAHVVAGRQQGGIGHRLAHAPVDRQLARTHLPAVIDDLLDARMQAEVIGNRCDALRQPVQFLLRHGGVALLGVRNIGMQPPVDGVLALVIGDHRIDQVPALVQRGAIVLDHALAVVGADDTLGRQLFGVELARAGMGGDPLVHQRLRHHRLVLLVVAELAEADDVDHDILAELLAELHGHLGDEGHRVGIVAIDMEDGRLDHLEDVGAVERGAIVAQVRSGKADLVVDHQMHGAAGAVTARLREVQHLLVHALAGDGGIAVDQHRHHFPAPGGATPHLARIHRAADHRVDDLEMRRVERQRQVHGPRRCRHVRGIAEVVLDVTGGQRLRLLALELLEQHFRLLA